MYPSDLPAEDALLLVAAAVVVDAAVAGRRKIDGDKGEVAVGVLEDDGPLRGLPWRPTNF